MAEQQPPADPDSELVLVQVGKEESAVAARRQLGQGLRTSHARKDPDRAAWQLRVAAGENLPLEQEVEKSLRANQQAWDNFNALAPGYRKQYVGWLQSAKKPETRKKRLKEAIGLLASNKKLGMK